MKKQIFFLLVFLSNLVSGCVNTECKNMGFERFQNTNRIEVTDNLGKVLRKIENPAEIKALVDFAMSYKSGWSTPWSGAPIALSRADFYQDDDFLGDFGVGSDFLSAQGCAYFQSREIDPKDRAKLIQLFGVKDPYSSRN
jgi:hypothetical protein